MKKTHKVNHIGKKGRRLGAKFWEKNAGLDRNNGAWMNRILVATPCTGLVRMEWTLARYGQAIPTNWSTVAVTQWMSAYAPVGYMLADAENLIAKAVVEGNFEWFLSWEEDNIPPLDAFMRLNEYMIKGDVPIVSGLYFTKSQPPEPIIYRGRGTGSYQDFKIGDKVWVDGIPFGFALIHGSIIRALWNESEEYRINDTITRRVFSNPPKTFGKPEDGSYATVSGTTDLAWCTRLMNEGIFKKAGWPEYQKKKYPFLVDTNINVQHITQAGVVYPLGGIPLKFRKIPALPKGHKLF